MQYLCICTQPDNSEHFKGHRPASPVEAYELNYSGGGGLAQVENKAQRWGEVKRVQKCENRKLR